MRGRSRWLELSSPQIHEPHSQGQHEVVCWPQPANEQLLVLGQCGIPSLRVPIPAPVQPGLVIPPCGHAALARNETATTLSEDDPQGEAVAQDPISPRQASRQPGARLLREQLFQQCLLLTASPVKRPDPRLLPAPTRAAGSRAGSLQLCWELAAGGWPYEGMAPCVHWRECSAPALCIPSLPFSCLSSLPLVPRRRRTLLSTQLSLSSHLRFVLAATISSPLQGRVGCRP